MVALPKERSFMKDFGSMNLIELKDELKREKEWLKECERNALLSRAQIEHLENCIKVAESNK